MPRSTRRDSADWFQPAGRRRRPTSVLTGGGAARSVVGGGGGSVAPSRAASSASIASSDGAGGSRPTRALSGVLWAPDPAEAREVWTAGRGREFTDDDTRSVLSALSALDAAADGGAFPAALWTELVDTFLSGAPGTQRWVEEQAAALDASRAAAPVRVHPSRFPACLRPAH